MTPHDRADAAIFPTFTPFGDLDAVFYADSFGVELEGPQRAIDYLVSVMGQTDNSQGMTMSPKTVEPHDYFYFCQPKDSGITILDPDGVMGNDDQNDTEHTAIMDSAIQTTEKGNTVMFDSVETESITTLRNQLLNSVGAVAKLAIAKAVLATRKTIATMMANKPQPHLFHSGEERLTPPKRQAMNNAAIKLLREIQQRGAATATEEEKAVLAKYTGNGGNLVRENGNKGSEYEYYTPKPIATAAWDILAELGFSGGKVLDPCAGSGIFGATRPDGVTVDAIELDDVSGGINNLVNGNCIVSPFEVVASRTPDEVYDAVITNIPFGSNRGGNAGKDPMYQDESLEGYFLLRTMRKLKPGGLAAYICPPRVVSGYGKLENGVRFKMSLMSEFIGAYRLPNSVFQLATEADTITDLVVFRKHSRDQKEIVDACMSNNQAQTLKDEKILWDEFIEGGYFKGEGRRFQLGEFIPGTPGDRYSRDRVELASGGNPADVAKLMVKLGQGRIDWANVDAVPVVPVSNNKGDAVYEGGAIRIYGNGSIEHLGVVPDSEKQAMMAKLATPLDAVVNGITHFQAKEFLAIADKDKVPAWLDHLEFVIGGTMDSGSFAGKVSEYWPICIASLAAVDAIERHGNEFNYLERYPEVSELIKKHTSKVVAARSAVHRAGKLVTALETALLVCVNSEFTPLWRGAIVQQVTLDLTPRQRFEAMRYEKGDERGAVTIEDWKSIYPNEDPLEGDDWCLTGDDMIVTAADYYIGKYGPLMVAIKSDLDNTTDETKRAKLIRQMNKAMALVNKPDYESMNYTLQGPYASAQTKLLYLQESINPGFYAKIGENGNFLYNFDSNSKDDFTKKKLKVLAKWMQTGKLSFSGHKKLLEEAPDEYEMLVAECKALVNDANIGFNLWMKTTGRTEQLNADFDLNNASLATVEESGDAIGIDGFTMMLDGRKIAFHDYQNRAIRQYTRNLSGICALDVGLGKTLVALGTVKHMHNVGAKKRTIIAVPKAVLSNWRREANSLYANTDDCLFVGLRTDRKGNDKIFLDQAKKDMAKISSGQYSKIFMSIDNFVAIPMRDGTVEDYLDFVNVNDTSYLSIPDDGSEASIVAAVARRDKEIEALRKGNEDLPFFETLGIDSVVIDEAHVFKNAKVAGGFSGIKFMSMPNKSLRAMSASIKLWYLRNLSPKKDGVLMLTATPITNSPLEIYAMMCLAQGEEKVNSALGGFSGANDFIAAYSTISNREEEGITGDMRQDVSVFDGLENLKELRRTLKSVALVKTAKEVGLPLPATDTVITSVPMDTEILQLLEGDKEIYKENARALRDGERDRETIMLGNPFNLVHKMTNGILDRDLYDNVTRYIVKDTAISKKAVIDFNKKEYKDKKRSHNSYLTLRENVLTTYDLKMGKKDEKGEKTNNIVKYNGDIGGYAFDVKVIGVTPDNGDDFKLAIDTINPVMQGHMLKFIKPENCEVTISPKIAALIENIKKELANPGIASGGRAKQVIFCDLLGMHTKIKMALTTKAGIPLSQIAVISGVETPDPEDVQDVSDGFNGNGEDNRYTVVIANKKAEVGINLQKGTQAIHHLTTGWTPDSLHQRNGRAVRQGNKAEKVTIYHYEADGSFDEYKRNLLSVKSDWIDSVLSPNSTVDTVTIGGGFTAKEYEELGTMFGDKEKIKQFMDERKKREAELFSRRAKDKQIALINALKMPVKFIKDNKDIDNFFKKAKKTRDSIKEEYEALKLKLKTANERLIKFEAEGSTDKERVNAANRLRARITSMKVELDRKLNELTAIQEKIADFDSAPYNDKENTAIGREWKAQIEKSNQAIEKIKAEFKLVTGAYAPDRIDDFVSGKAQVIPAVNELVSDGMIGVNREGNLFIVQGSLVDNDLIAYILIGENIQYGDSIAKIIGAKYFDSGDPSWHDKLRALADFDTARARKGLEMKATVYIPEAAQYLPDDLPVEFYFNNKNVILKSPAFPIPFPASGGRGGFYSKIVESQQGIISTIASSSNKKYSVGKERFELLSEPFNDDFFAQAMLDFALLHSYVIQDSDIAYWTNLSAIARKRVRELVLGVPTAVIGEELKSKVFTSQDDLESYIVKYETKIKNVYEFNFREYFYDEIKSATRRVEAKQFGDNVMLFVGNDGLKYETSDVFTHIEFEMETNAADYVELFNGQPTFKEEKLFEFLKAKGGSFDGFAVHIFPFNDAVAVVPTTKMMQYAKTVKGIKDEMTRLRNASLPEGTSEKIKRIESSPGVDRCKIYADSLFVNERDISFTFPPMSLLIIETRWKGTAGKKLMFDKTRRTPPVIFVKSLSPSAWVVPLFDVPGMGRMANIDIVMQYLGV